MLRQSARSKRESISRDTQRTGKATSYTRAATAWKHARTSANTKEACSPKTSKTWMAGETIHTTKASCCVGPAFHHSWQDMLCSHRTVKCTKHNWKLNVSTMKYVNPPDSFLQDELGKFCHYIPGYVQSFGFSADEIRPLCKLAEPWCIISNATEQSCMYVCLTGFCFRDAENLSKNVVLFYLVVLLLTELLNVPVPCSCAHTGHRRSLL